MATVAELERLESLLERLIPLADKVRGELIEADDWNLLVGSLIEVGRSTLSDEASIPDHEHPDQVGVGWLDAQVRELVTGGGLKDPGVETQFLKLRRDIDAMRRRLDALSNGLDSSRARIEEVSTNDLIRERAVTTLNRKVLGAADDRSDIADLRTTLRTLETEVVRAVEVGAQLEVNGEPLDVAGLVSRVDEVETLRERLTQANGELLDAIAFERRLSDVETSTVSESDLTSALEDFRETVGSGSLDLDRVLDESRLASRETATAIAELMANDLRTEVNTRFNEIGPTVDLAVDRRTASLTDDVLTTTRSERADELAASEGAVRSDLQALIDRQIAATNETVSSRFAEIPDLIAGEVSGRLDEGISGAIGEIGSRLDGLDADLGRLGDQLSESSRSLETLETSLGVALRREAAERARVRTELLGRIAQVEIEIGPRIQTVVDESRAILRTDLEATVAAARRDLEGRLDRVAREAAVTEVQVLSTSVRTDVQSIVRQEIGATLADVRTEMTTEVDSINRRVAGLVANEVARATADVPRLVRENFETFRPEIRRMIAGRNRIVPGDLG